MHEKRIFQGAFALSLLLHLVFAAATWRIPFTPTVDFAQAEDQEMEVELFLMPDEPGAEMQHDTTVYQVKLEAVKPGQSPDG